jgi:hypothetical protein
VCLITHSHIMPAFYSLVFGNRTTPLINDIRISQFGFRKVVCTLQDCKSCFCKVKVSHSHTHSNTNSIDGKAGMSIILLPSCNLRCMILVSIWYNAATGVSLYLLSSNVIVKQSNEVNVCNGPCSGHIGVRSEAWIISPALLDLP